MPKYELIKTVSEQRLPLNLSGGARLDITIAAPSSASPLSSSFAVVEFPVILSSSSAVAGTDRNLLLFRRKSGRDFFLGIASPLDMETWPVDIPDVITGFYRTTSGSWTFRLRDLLDDFWTSIVSDVQQLANLLGLLAPLRALELISYDFSPGGVGWDSSSSARAGSRVFHLRREGVVSYPSINPAGYRLKVTCTAEGADKNIFLHRDDLPDRAQKIHVRPLAVCSPSDLVDYPAGLVSSDDFPPHYRLGKFDIVAANINDISSGWLNIKTEVKQLAGSLKFQQDSVSERDVLEISNG